MPIFKFTKEKPSALKIWTTLVDTPIHPREGYTEDQIRYRMFIYLQLSGTNFKEAVLHCNNVLDTDKTNLGHLLSSTCSLASCSESGFSNLDVLSQAFPHWVSSELYTPYYLTKMLCHKLDNDSLLGKLFDRDSMSPGEIHHWNIDCGNQPGLTAYKRYNSIHMDEMLPYIIISYDRTPMPISNKNEIMMFTSDQLMQSIEVSDNFIIPEGSKITIPYFVLKTNTTVPPVPPMPQKPPSTKPFVVGDKVRLRSGLVDNERYGGMTFMDNMRFSVVATIEGTNVTENVKVKGMSFWYAPEMLEHVEGDTDASCQV